MKPFAITHQGFKKEENQDRYFIRELNNQTFLMAVADGMGGEAGGGLAAQITIEAFKDFKPGLKIIETSLFKPFQAASQRIGEEVQKDLELEGMGTTLTAAYIKNKTTYWAHVGDCRLYLWWAGCLIQTTEDHIFYRGLYFFPLIMAGT